MPAANFNNNTFRGKINDEGVIDYYRKLRKIKYGTAEERIEKIKEILGIEEIDGTQFSNEFWTKIFLQPDDEDFNGGIKLVLSTSDSLYTDSNVASCLELAGTMIIRGEKKVDNPEQYMRVFHSRELFKKELDEYEKMRNVVLSTNDGKHALSSGNGDYFVLANQMNYKFEKKWTQLDDAHLKKLDEHFSPIYPVVHDYYVGYLELKERLKEYIETVDLSNLTQEEFARIRMMNKNIRSTKVDFIDSIYAKMRPIMFKAPLPDSGSADWDMFDETDRDHIRQALRVKKGNDMQDDASVIIKDLDNTIQMCDLNDRQKKIVELLKTEMSLAAIAREVGIHENKVEDYINVIINKIIHKNYELIEDWYYLNVVKAKYKKCSKCGEILPVSRFSKRGNGYQSRCIKCRSEDRRKK